MGEALSQAQSFLASLGSLVIQYNDVEDSLRRLLRSACNPDKNISSVLMSSIMTVDLHTVGVENALKSYAEALSPKEIAEHINHAVDYAVEIRMRRNYFVHGISYVVQTTDGPVGIVMYTSAKAKFKEHKDSIYKHELDDVVKRCAISIVFNDKVGSRLGGLLGAHPDLPVLPLPDKPTLLGKLSKPGQPWTERLRRRRVV